MPRNHFDVLGVKPVFHLSADELEKKYLELSRQFHPDKFAKAAPRERLEAVQRTTELNDAYKVLRDPVKRAEYLLKLNGIDVADEKGASVKAPPALLGEMMELNEQLAESRADLKVVRQLAEAVTERRAEAMHAVEAGFRAVEAGDTEALKEVAEAVIAMRYHARFLEQAEAIESGDDARGGL
jgi:molecular chaperone HscB